MVDVAATQPSMLLVKGSYTAPKPTVEGEEPVTERRQAPTGLALFGGTGLGKFRDQFLIACGNAPDATATKGDSATRSAPPSGSPAGSARKGAT